jgi:hypothetical protein
MGYAPDILHLVNDSSLKDIGIKPGDIIHLKQNLLQWLNSAASKHKQGDLTHSAPLTPPNKWVHFEKQFHNGGSAWVYGPRIVEAEGDLPEENIEYDWYYYCEAHNAWVPVSSRCVPVLEPDSIL